MEKFDYPVKDAQIEKPRALYNVLVCYTLHYQDFWTRGFLVGDTWNVILWDKKVVVPFNEIRFWMPLPIRLT